MRKILALATIAVSLLLTLTSCTMIMPSGIITQHNYYYQNFDSVEIDSAFQASIIRNTGGYSVSVTLDQNADSYLNVYVSGSTLHIGLNPGTNAGANLNLNATISMPSIYQVSAGGASTVSVNSFSPGTFNATASGASTLTLAGMSINNSYLTVSGASTLKSNSSSTNYASVQVTGASTLRIPVKFAASGNVSGASTFIYGGYNPDLSGLTTVFPSSSIPF